MRFLRHLGRLMGEFLGFAWQNAAWWIVPVVIVLLLLTALVILAPTTGQLFIYTLW